ncbi:MAG: hypothetical protein V4660_08540 [Pseudomonadota bacterium]
MILLSQNQAQHQEYSARYGLKGASDDIDAAQQIAEAKYRALVGRDVWISEISEIHHLIDEMRNWAAPVPRSTSCAH